MISTKHLLFILSTILWWLQNSILLEENVKINSSRTFEFMN